MNFETVNLKELCLSREDVSAHLDIIITSAKKNDIGAIKLLHGYGSHGQGGAICLELKRLLPLLKKQKIISGYFGGNEWDISNDKCQKFLLKCPSCSYDEDLNHSNPGITIVTLI